MYSEPLTLLRRLATEVAHLVGKSGQVLLTAVSLSKVARHKGVAAAAVDQRVAVPAFDAQCCKERVVVITTM